MLSSTMLLLIVMGIRFHPGQGSVVVCDYSTGFMLPEMVKRRPVIVLCKPMKGRPGLCSVVPLSTTPPRPVMPYHLEIELPFALPPPFDAPTQWVKGDMISAVSYDRLDLVRLGKDARGQRVYLKSPIGPLLLRRVQRCVLEGLSLI